jgi:CHASE2 domain-containing sensor protein
MRASNQHLSRGTEPERRAKVGKPTGRRPQRRLRQAIIGLLIVLLVALCTEVATRAGWLSVLELVYYDLWHLLAGSRGEPRHVVIVSVDTQAFLDHRDEPLVFWGPYFAQAIEKARRAGAGIIGLDYLFSVSAESWLNKIALVRATKGVPMTSRSEPRLPPAGWCSSAT